MTTPMKVEKCEKNVNESTPKHKKPIIPNRHQLHIFCCWNIFQRCSNWTENKCPEFGLITPGIGFKYTHNYMRQQLTMSMSLYENIITLDSVRKLSETLTFFRKASSKWDILCRSISDTFFVLFFNFQFSLSMCIIRTLTMPRRCDNNFEKFV